MPKFGSIYQESGVQMSIEKNGPEKQKGSEKNKIEKLPKQIVGITFGPVHREKPFWGNEAAAAFFQRRQRG
ncbi:hypothetical protein GCM10011494_34480 [Novosphingobium endophyticum]|uniref:Uncharacterized protein n=1 Tax=Novosphingobium endophyticum TaxID=1955250 RepID=A0A916X6Y9_9SPHN|nr:hypothetical protein GCM10011494_34480 [Novosphingobium endophyticum]